MPEDSISRRQFLCRSLLAAGAGCCIPSIAHALVLNRGEGELAGRVTVRISDHPELMAVNGSVRVGIPGLWFRIIITRVSADQFITVSEVCRHHGCDIGDLDTETMRFTCPCHFSQYAVDGTVLKGPSIRNLERFATTWDGGDILEIEIDALSSADDDDGARSYLDAPVIGTSASTCLLRYGLDRRSHLVLALYSSSGQEILRLVDDVAEAGSHSTSFDLSSLAAGFYLCRMQTSYGFTATSTFIVDGH